MPDLEPITRDEMLWSGEDVEPITRREMYIRHLYDETQVIPDKPITREEMFILKAGEELHDVTIEQLNVSENGAYSESGKAYSPVIVDVSLPENAYLLKDIPNTPCDIATFTDGSNLPMPSLKVGIEPIQEGSGDPSPTNIRPISGWSGANVVDDAVYGGFIDWNQLAKELNSTNWVAVSSTATYSNEEVTLTSSNNNPAAKYLAPFSQTTLNHVYYVYGKGKSDGTAEVSIGVWQENGGDYSGTTGTGWVASTSYTDIYKIAKTTAKTSIIGARLRNAVPSGNYGVFKDINIIDLTQLFGETKADEIYAMEQAEAGSGVAYFKSLFYKDYYPYNSGEITNVSAVNGDTDKYRTYTIQFTDSQGNPIEVFGGECDVVNGGGSAYKEYDSYNGETLIGPWISDRDVYAPNTSPTIGAQVVDMGDTSTFTSQPTSIKSIEGNNNVWGDCGNVSEGSYFSKGEEE